MILAYLAEHLFIDLRNQILQAHHAPVPGLERLPVPSVHRSKAEKGQPCIFVNQLCLARAAEHLRKVQILPLVNDIDDMIRLPVFHPHHDRRQISRIVQRRTV